MKNAILTGVAVGGILSGILVGYASDSVIAAPPYQIADQYPTTETRPFLPAYLDMLQGKPAPLPDNACRPATTPGELILPDCGRP